MSITNKVRYIISYMENPSLDYLVKDEDFLMTYDNLTKAVSVLDNNKVGTRELAIALRLLNNKLVICTVKKMNLGSTLESIISHLINTYKVKSRRCPRRCTA